MRSETVSASKNRFRDLYYNTWTANAGCRAKIVISRLAGAYPVISMHVNLVDLECDQEQRLWPVKARTFAGVNKAFIRCVVCRGNLCLSGEASRTF